MGVSAIACTAAIGARIAHARAAGIITPSRFAFTVRGLESSREMRKGTRGPAPGQLAQLPQGQAARMRPTYCISPPQTSTDRPESVLPLTTESFLYVMAVSVLDSMLFEKTIKAVATNTENMNGAVDG